jgi:acetyltransferase-like isoleucine patch superfamily enzyme
MDWSVMFDSIKRLYWDLLDKNERKYYLYWMIREIPGLFGNMLRAKYLSRRFKGVGSNLSVYAGCRFRSLEGITVGNNVNIGYDDFIQGFGGVNIGNDVAIGPGVKIWSVNHNVKAKDILVKDQGLSEGEINIGNDVFIGADCIILPGVTLPDGVVILAGSVVNIKAYKPYSIIGGNPARVVGYRE